ncbi:hypothetical protein BMS3Abin06_01438 [bacterium BMS3Abin06]|nr:hypothetical protein BMS3Abin06_01438 [bacterium BMS3Abin06]
MYSTVIKFCTVSFLLFILVTTYSVFVINNVALGFYDYMKGIRLIT